MVVTVRATLDETQRPIDWTTEIWSGKHSNRPGGGGNLLAAEALPDPPPPPAAVEVVGPARSWDPQWRTAVWLRGPSVSCIHLVSRNASADLVAYARALWGEL